MKYFRIALALLAVASALPTMFVSQSEAGRQCAGHTGPGQPPCK